jgi:hypothetical protein
MGGHSPFIAQLVNETGVTGGDSSKIGYYAGLIVSLPPFSSTHLLTTPRTGIDLLLHRKPLHAPVRTYLGPHWATSSLDVRIIWTCDFNLFVWTEQDVWPVGFYEGVGGGFECESAWGFGTKVGLIWGAGKCGSGEEYDG